MHNQTLNHSNRFGPEFFGLARRTFSLSLLALLLTVWQGAANVPVVLAASADLDQCANGASGTHIECKGTGSGSDGWTNGNVNAQKAHWREDDSLPYRMKLEAVGNGAVWTLVIGWDVTANGKHAIDYLTSFDRTETQTLGDNPCDTVGCSLSNMDTFTIPGDPAGPQNCQPSGGSQIAGSFSIFGASGTTVDITSVSAYGLTGCPAATGSTENSIAIRFTSTDPNPVIAWGGHIATQVDWGVGNAAAGINGSSYHMRLLGLCQGTFNAVAPNACTTGGNQDRSLSAAAVVASTIATQTSATAVSVPGSVRDTATVAGNATVVPAGTITFYICGPSTSAPGASGTLLNGCTSQTTQVGATKTLNGSGSATSDAYFVTSSGYYCFLAVYTPAAGSPYPSATHTNTIIGTNGECFRAIAATGFYLDSFRAVGRAFGAKLRWRTANELAVVGFQVLRSRNENGPFKQINSLLIDASHPGSLMGDTYSYRDKTAQRGKTYYYKVQVEGANGTLESSEVEKVKMP